MTVEAQLSSSSEGLWQNPECRERFVSFRIGTQLLKLLLAPYSLSLQQNDVQCAKLERSYQFVVISI
jgi:hypothetical protein